MRVLVPCVGSHFAGVAVPGLPPASHQPAAYHLSQNPLYCMHLVPPSAARSMHAPRPCMHPDCMHAQHILWPTLEPLALPSGIWRGQAHGRRTQPMGVLFPSFYLSYFLSFFGFCIRCAPQAGSLLPAPPVMRSHPFPACIFQRFSNHLFCSARCHSRGFVFPACRLHRQAQPWPFQQLHMHQQHCFVARQGVNLNCVCYMAGVPDISICIPSLSGPDRGLPPILCSVT